MFSRALTTQIRSGTKFHIFWRLETSITPHGAYVWRIFLKHVFDALFNVGFKNIMHMVQEKEAVIGSIHWDAKEHANVQEVLEILCGAEEGMQLAIAPLNVIQLGIEEFNRWEYEENRTCSKIEQTGFVKEALN